MVISTEDTRTIRRNLVGKSTNEGPVYLLLIINHPNETNHPDNIFEKSCEKFYEHDEVQSIEYNQSFWRSFKSLLSDFYKKVNYCGEHRSTKSSLFSL